MNNIISISGMPISGKSTTIKQIIEELKNRGFNKENIHLVSTGKEFRNYFNFIIDLLSNINDMDFKIEKCNDAKIKKLFSSKNFRNIIINLIVNMRKNGYDLSSFSIEQANNLECFKDLRYIIDTTVDTDIEKLGKDIQEKNSEEDFWIIDSRLAFHNIPESFAVRLTIDEDIAAKRLLADSSRGNEDNNYKNEKEAKKAIIKRKNGEVKRYIERYNVNLEDEDNYDLIIDTSYSKVEDIAEAILDCHQMYNEKKYFGKNWTSPKKLLPLQTERDTLGRGTFMNMDEMINSIKENGYKVGEEIEVIKVDNKDYIIEGHHRNFGAALAGKTLVPYTIIAKDDEQLPSYYGKESARKRIIGFNKNDLIGHEWMFGKQFSYTDIYPNIYNEFNRNEGR